VAAAPALVPRGRAGPAARRRSSSRPDLLPPGVEAYPQLPARVTGAADGCWGALCCCGACGRRSRTSGTRCRGDAVPAIPGREGSSPSSAGDEVVDRPTRDGDLTGAVVPRSPVVREVLAISQRTNGRPSRSCYGLPAGALAVTPLEYGPEFLRPRPERRTRRIFYVARASVRWRAKIRWQALAAGGGASGPDVVSADRA